MSPSYRTARAETKNGTVLVPPCYKSEASSDDYERSTRILRRTRGARKFARNKKILREDSARLD